MSLIQGFLVTLIAVTLSAVFCFRWKRRRLYQLAKKIPGPEGLPVLGELHHFSNLKPRVYVEKVLSYCRPENKVSKGWFGPFLVVLTDDADCIHTIMKAPQALLKPSYFYNALQVDHGLIAGNGEEHERHRKILNKSFTVKMIQKLLPTFNEKAKKCIGKLSKLANGGDFDVYQYVGTCTLESLCSGQLNYPTDHYESDFLKSLEDVRPLIMKRMFSPWYNFKPLYKLSSLSRSLDYYVKIMNENIGYIKEANKKSPNNEIKDLAINLLMDPKNNFNEEEIRDEVATLILAGQESTAVVISSALLMLAMNKEMQQKIIDEIDEVVGSTDEIDSELLSNLCYTEMVIKESLRLFATGGIVARETIDEMELGGFTIPKGTTLVMSIYGMQRSPKYWGDDAHLFRPERFEPENIKNVHPHALAPFSGGKRVCIAQKYAMAFMKIVLLNFFKSFTVDTKLKYDEIKLEITPTLIMSEPYMISIKNRQIKVNN